MATGGDSRPLTDAMLARLAHTITRYSMEQIALAYLNFREKDIKSLRQTHLEDTEAFKRQILLIWKNRSNASVWVKFRIGSFVESKRFLKHFK